ncbi:GNAT family N-acetyltransferase [Streptomyces sp. NBC_01465]|uniref:GNAT family N-acetyltransferase n=1 Tax=Streptomyces sp. NBC_01465 TaxID=2903878 RepID=UPI002E339A24|nr:GNAT family N-acetyltransferase [Streptomyces sp. NBC_01465]
MIRTALPTDVDTIAAFHAAARATYYEGHIPESEYATPAIHAQVKEGWHRAVARADGAVLCAEDGGRAVAVAAFKEIDGTMTLTQFHVDPARWSRGVGSALHTAVVAAWQQAEVPAARLEVFEHNLRAQRFYARHGWAADGRDSDHVRMSLTVPAGE